MNGPRIFDADPLGKGREGEVIPGDVIFKVHTNDYGQSGHGKQQESGRLGHGLCGHGVQSSPSYHDAKGDQMNRIEEWRSRRGLTMQQLGELVGCDASTINKLEKGHRRLTDKWLHTIATALHCSPQDLMGPPVMVQVIGRVGAGQQMIPYDDFESGSGLREVAPPVGVSASLVGAVEVCGDSMYPIKDGWVLFFRRDYVGVQADDIGKLCICATDQGVRYVKELHRGRDAGTFTLTSWNAPPIENVHLEWASRVIDIRPT